MTRPPHQLGSQRAMCSQERSWRSRCQLRKAATRVLASLRWRAEAAWTTSQSPASRAPRTSEGLGGRGGRAGEPAGGAQDAAHRRVEPAVRALEAAVGAVLERRGVAGDRQRAQDVGVEHLQGLAVGCAEGAQAADEQQELLQRRLLLLGDQAFGGLEHGGAGGVAVVVAAHAGVEQRARLGLGDDVEVAALGELEVDVGEGLEPGAELRGRTAHALGDRAHPPVVAGQQGDDAVGLAQLVGAQHDRLVAVERHPSIIPRGWSTRAARPARAAPAGRGRTRRRPGRGARGQTRHSRMLWARTNVALGISPASIAASAAGWIGSAGWPTTRAGMVIARRIVGGRRDPAEEQPVHDGGHRVGALVAGVEDDAGPERDDARAARPW